MTPKKKEKPRSKDAPLAVMVGEHGRYQIKSGRLAGQYVARAFPKPPTKTRGLIAEATGATEEAAIAALRAEIDARESRRTEERRTDPRTGSAVPSSKEYVEAMGQIGLSRPQRSMLKALSIADTDGLNETAMAVAAGYKSVASACRSFAGAGLLIARYLSVTSAPQGEVDELEGTGLLGQRGTSQNGEKLGNWILHPELRDAVRIAL